MTKLARKCKEADKLWFHKHLKSKCELCENQAKQCHHFYYKRNFPHLRYSKQNAISLCMKCHFIAHHQDPKLIEDKIIEKRGKRWHTSLKKEAYNPPKYFKINLKWYQDNIDKLK